jgi:hypothetical protein
MSVNIICLISTRASAFHPKRINQRIRILNISIQRRIATNQPNRVLRDILSHLRLIIPEPVVA